MWVMTLGEGQRMQFFVYEEVKKLRIGFGFDKVLKEYFEASADDNRRSD